MVFGDLMIVIPRVREAKHRLKAMHSPIEFRIILQLQQFKQFYLFHVLRNLNSIADTLEKIGTRLSQGTIKLNNDHQTIIPLP